MKGGYRPGAGRKKGTKAPKTLERLKILEAYRQRAMVLTDRLLDKQLHLAQGQTFLYKIEKELIIGPKGGKSYKAKKPELVENELEIRSYLEGLVEEGDMNDSSDPAATFYFITVKEPDSHTIDSILNRTFGTAVQSTKLVDEDDKAITFMPTAGMNEAQIDEYLQRKLTRSSQAKGFKQKV